MWRIPLHPCTGVVSPSANASLQSSLPLPACRSTERSYPHWGITTRFASISSPQFVTSSISALTSLSSESSIQAMILLYAPKYERSLAAIRAMLPVLGPTMIVSMSARFPAATITSCFSSPVASFFSVAALVHLTIPVSGNTMGDCLSLLAYGSHARMIFCALAATSAGFAAMSTTIGIMWSSTRRFLLLAVQGVSGRTNLFVAGGDAGVFSGSFSSRSIPSASGGPAASGTTSALISVVFGIWCGFTR